MAARMSLTGRWAVSIIKSTEIVGIEGYNTMLNQFSRTQLLLGEEAMDRLKKARVAVFGVGGVGGYVCEALVRSGVGAFDLIDDDKVCLTNLNRQIIATRKTVGQYKVDVMQNRMLEINPALPHIAGTTLIPVEKVHYFMEGDNTVPNAPIYPRTEIALPSIR